MAVSFKDTFNGAGSPTNLGSWTPTDVGSTWTIGGSAAANTWVVQTSGVLRYNESANANGRYYAYDDSNHAGGYVEVTTPSTFGVSAHNVFALRLVDADNWVGISFAGSGSAGTRVITCVSGTVDDTHYQGQGAASTTYRIEDDGTDIRFYFGGSLVHTLTNYTAVSASETKKGLVLVDGGSANIDTLDSYESGTLAASDEITLTDVSDYRVVPRNGSGQGSITVSGTYSGTPTAIQYRIVSDGTDTAISGHDWSTLDGSPSGGSFSGTISTIPEGGWYNVDVRFSNDTGVTDGGTSKWGVGYHIVIGGQSHAEDMRTDSTGTPNALLAKYSGGWSAHGTTGAGDIALGNAVITALGGGIPVAIFNGAVGGSALSQEADGGSGYWEAGAASLYDTWTVSVDAMGGAPHFGIFWQGDRDAISGVVTEAEYETRLAAAISQYRTDYGASLPVIIGLLNRDDAAVDADWQAIRNAQLDVSVADSDTYYFSVVDLTTEVDGQHLADASLVTAGQRIANIINYLNGDASYWRGPYISGFTKNSNTTGTVTITHVGGSDFTPTGASAITGFEVSDDQSTWESATASRASATTIDLSWSTSFAGAVYVRYMYGGDPSETGAVVDNATVALPLEYLGRDYVAGGGGVSQELTGNSSTSAVGTLDVATEGSVSVTPEGVSATSAVGTIGATAEINASAELTGVSSSGAVGAITAEVGGGTTANLSGNESAASVGTLGVSTEVNAFVDLLGNSATGAVGTLIVVTGLQVALSGNAATGAVGTLGVTAEVNASAALTGVGSSGAVGTLEITVPIAVSVELTGVGATGAIGTLTAVGAGQVWTEISPVSTIWTEIS